MANEKTPNYHWDIPNPYGLQIVEMIKVASTFGAIDSRFKAFEDAYQNHKHSFADISNRPTTLSGYGITDAITTDQVRREIETSQAAQQLVIDQSISNLASSTAAALDVRLRFDVQQPISLINKARARANINALGIEDKGVSNGVATLDAGGKIPSSQLPQAVLDADKTTLASVTSAMSQAPLGGDIDESNDRLFLLVNGAPSKRYGWPTIKAWIKSWISKTDVGLSNVDNTSDANKPVSTAQQSALNAKQNNLGFTPVEQGGFAGVGSNKIRIGWGTGAVLRLRVDASDYGQNWPIDIRGTANNADNFGSMSVATWQNFVQANSWPGVSWSDGSNELNFPVGHIILANGSIQSAGNITSSPRLASGGGGSGYTGEAANGASSRLNGTWKTRGGSGNAGLYQRVG